MVPIQAYLAAIHIDDLMREAHEARLARLARDGNEFGDGSPRGPRRPDLRRSLARAAINLSLIADDAARRLDPSGAPSDAFGSRHAVGAAGR